ncbi:GDSL-type esterase/lipase family protein [Aestuariivivens sp. NBU2969]|uniref:GDSL-type esterase/lipase family protein n=1 Tax=Aestuariivivens sp. NBU2969 TaxID=2873267 RepID=UPI001CBFA0CA|nr:GDSL-type esterase/lipase family protein [Aestuariivivens sp. NBU2969]
MINYKMDIDHINLKQISLWLFFITCLGCKEIDHTIKIACIGDSITYGYGVANRENNNYPQQLQNLLGDDYEVKNFGVSGNTLLKKGDYPYWASDKYQEALAFVPDVVYIKLGTNDSKVHNRIYLDTDFEKDYKNLIESFKQKNKNVRVVLLLPVPAFTKDSSSIWNPVIKEQIIPLTQKVAFDTQSEVLDLYQLFIDAPQLLPDTVHPSSLGATRMARRVYEDVTFKSQEETKLFNVSKGQDIKQSSFHGFVQNDFLYKGTYCKVVEPKRVAEGKPWVIRARFWGHEPQTDIALLERGFHIAYCDVANLFGNSEAVKRWNGFYDFMTENGFSKKVVLEGMSRGGLIVYNWAVENPEKVACVYADAPVLDGASWPGGMGEGKGSLSDWERFREAYHIISEDKLINFKENPIHYAEAIAKAGFPMMHVCGEADTIVPVDENTRPFEEKITDAGGNIITIYKAGVQHHPHSLENPTPIVDFILRATNRKINFAIVPSPSSEYRSGAGWKQGKGWWYQMSDIDSLCRITKNLDILLIGNSITQGWGGGRTLTTYNPGKVASEIHFKGLKYISGGISGDRTEHVLWRLQKGNYNVNQPKLVTLAIGVNNFAYNSANEISAGIIKVVELMETTFPDSEILFFGLLPTGLDKHSDRRKKHDAIHESIKHLGEKKAVHYYNMVKVFSDENGNLNPDYYSGDGIHLKPEGYYVWGNFIRKKYNELIIKP